MAPALKFSLHIIIIIFFNTVELKQERNIITNMNGLKLVSVQSIPIVETDLFQCSFRHNFCRLWFLRKNKAAIFTRFSRPYHQTDHWQADEFATTASVNWFGFVECVDGIARKRNSCQTRRNVKRFRDGSMTNRFTCGKRWRRWTD